MNRFPAQSVLLGIAIHATLLVALIGPSAITAGMLQDGTAVANIRVGERLYKQRLVFEFESPRRNPVTRISLYDVDADSEPEIVITGMYESCIVSREYRAERCFSHSILFDPNVVDVNSDGKPEFLNGYPTHGTAELMDLGGKIIWVYRKGNWLSKSVAVDSDGDGTMEIVTVGPRWRYRSGEQSLLFFNLQKELLRRVDTEFVRHMRSGDLDDDGRAEIVSRHSGNRIVVRTSTGEIRSQKTLDYPFLFELARRIDRRTYRIVIARRDADLLEVLDADLQSLVSLQSPLSKRLTIKSCELLSLDGYGHDGVEEGLVTIMSTKATGSSALYVNQSSGKLIYHELLDDYYEGLLVLDAPAGRPSSFLIGGRGQVWLYTPVGSSLSN